MYMILQSTHFLVQQQHSNKYCLLILLRLTHAILEWRHDLHVLSRYPQLVGVNVIGGATLLALVTICLHGCTAIFSVKAHTYHSGEVRLSKTEQDTVQVKKRNNISFLTVT